MVAGFQAGVATDDQRKEIRPGEAACGVFFYVTVFVQCILFIVVLSTQNAKMPQDDGSCPDGYGFRHHFYCIEDALVDEMTSCLLANVASGRRLEDSSMVSVNTTFTEHMRKLSRDDGPASPKQLMARKLAARRLQGSFVPQDLWQFLEEFIEMPITIFSAMLFVSSLWLFAMTKATGAVVWGTLVFDILVMVVAVIWCLVEFESFNYMMAFLAVAFSVGLAVCRKQIQTAIVVMHKAMEGLTQNGRLFFISFVITLVWVAFFGIWIASLIGLDMAKTIGVSDDGHCNTDCSGGVCRTVCKSNPCAVINTYPGELRWLWIIVYYWSTFFFNNAKLIVITCQLGEWFFKGDAADKTIWRKAIVWAFHPLKSGGANAVCAAIMGLTQYLMSYVNSKCRTILAMFNPIEWIPLCVAYALKVVIHTYTKFGLVAQAYSAQPFCVTASNTFQLLKNKLGEAIICDYIGKRVLSWCTYLLSLGVAMAALTWGNVLQNFDDANKIFEEPALVILVMLVLAYFVSMPFFSIIFIVIMEGFLPNDMDVGVRAILNSVFAAIFMGSITNFLLKTMSHVVISAMDVIYFCFAVEDDLGQTQERFKELYVAIKQTIAPGTAVNNTGVVMGQPPAGSAAQQMMAVQVPAGVAPGTLIQVQGPNGPLQVQVPAGVQPGQVFNMAIPTVVVVQAAPAAQVVGVTQVQGNEVSNEVPATPLSA